MYSTHSHYLLVEFTDSGWFSLKKITPRFCLWHFYKNNALKFKYFFKKEKNKLYKI